MEAASGKEFCRHWMHCEHLLVRGKKMSKSIGNIIYPEDLFHEGFTGQQFRFYLLFGEYRVQQSFTSLQLKKACGVLADLRSMTEVLAPNAGESFSPIRRKAIGAMVEGFERCMNENLDIKAVIHGLLGALKQAVELQKDGRLSEQDRNDIQSQLRRVDSVLRVLFDEGSA